MVRSPVAGLASTYRHHLQDLSVFLNFKAYHPSIHTSPFTPLTNFSSGFPHDILALQAPFTQFITNVRSLQSLFNFFSTLLSGPLHPHSLHQKKAWILSSVLHNPLFFCCTSLAVGYHGVYIHTHTHTQKETVLQSTSHFIAIGCQLQQYIIRWKKKQRRFESKPYTHLTAPVRAMIRRVCKIAFFWVIRNNASFIPLSPKQEPLQYLNKGPIAAKAESQHYLITSCLFLSIIFSWIVGQRA